MSLKNFVVLALSVSLAIGVTLTSGCAVDETTIVDETSIIEDITPQEAFTLIQDNQNNPKFAIIDVRTPAEFGGGHIENATNIDFYSESFQDRLNTLDKNKTYLVYCRSGSRSRSALDIMVELNFKQAYNMLGGINQWTAGGFPTVK